MPGSLKDTLETILVVDNTKAVLEMVVRTPKTQTSKCFQPEADLTLSRLAAETNRRIQLLLSDVGMPEVSSPGFRAVLPKKSRPDMHVMLMSGGADGNLLVLNFTGGPFFRIHLYQRSWLVTDVLHSPGRSQLGGREFDSRVDRLGRSRLSEPHSFQPNRD